MALLLSAATKWSCNLVIARMTYGFLHPVNGAAGASRANRGEKPTCRAMGKAMTGPHTRHHGRHRPWGDAEYRACNACTVMGLAKW